MSWNLYRTFEAVCRLGSLTLAAKALDLSQSTVSRQLDRLEEEAESPLLLRRPPVELTERGRHLLKAISPMVNAAQLAEAALQGTETLSGEVTITTVGEVLRWVLVGHLHRFYDANPGCRLRILTRNEINSLAGGEADIALRLIRPERGDLIAKKVASAEYGYFAAASLPLNDDTPWLGLAGSLDPIKDNIHAARSFGNRRARLLVEDYESLGLAVQEGLGVAVLSRGFAASLEGVVEITPGQVGASDLGPIPTRSFWMVVHRSKQHVPRVRAVINWLTESMAMEGERLKAVREGAKAAS